MNKPPVPTFVAAKLPSKSFSYGLIAILAIAAILIVLEVNQVSNIVSNDSKNN